MSPDERGEEELDGGGGAGAEARAPARYALFWRGAARGCRALDHL